MKKSFILTLELIIISILICACATNSTQKTKTEDKMTLSPAATLSEVSNHCPKEILKANPDVDYGKIIHSSYYSTVCSMNRNFNIYLPAGYDGTKKYPVLYMLHGIFGNEYSFTGDQNMHMRELLSNMSSYGLSEEFIVVFPDMFATSNPAIKPSFNEQAVSCYDNFINDLTTDLMPYIESNYSVKTGRENTAICGFSMGGRETLFISLSRSDLFNYACAIAPAPGLVPAKDWAMQHKGQIEEKDLVYKEPVPKLVVVCCGTNDGTVGAYPKTYHNIFEKNGVEHFWYEVIGADHNNIAIQSGLFHFLQFIFK